MRIILLIIAITAAAVLCDWYIYRRLIGRHRPPRGIKIAYILASMAVDGLALAALVCMRSMESYSDAHIRTMMWCIGIFFLMVVPKLTFTAISMLDYPVGAALRRRSHIFGWLGMAAALFVGAHMLYGLTIGRSSIRVTRVEIVSDRLPASFDGLRIAQFSDLHIANLVNRDRFLTAVVDSLNSLGPDIVIQSGDIVNALASELDQGALNSLGRIRARYGVYAVLGNHDLGIYVRDTLNHRPKDIITDLVRRQQSIGWQVLRDSTAYVGNGTDTIAVTGLGYPYDPSLNSSHVLDLPEVDMKKAYGAVPEGMFNVTISHAPQLWDDVLAAGKADLTLSGHIHSMQIKVCRGERGWSPAVWLYDRWSGLYEEAGRYLYINDGLGYVMYPMRIGTRPELTLFTIRTKEKSKNT